MPSPLLLLVSALSTTTPADSLDRFIGDWECSGYFIRTHRSLASTLAITRDQDTGALVVHHDDAAPGTYRSLELWTMDRDGTLRASIADRSGARWFAASLWNGRTLAWDRADAGVTAERFSYTFLDRDMMRVDWSAARPGQPLHPGDTLTCRRTA